MANPTQYERIVKDLLEAQLQSEIPAAGFVVHHNAHYLGKSGHNHQIDVSAEFHVAGVRILVLVECKEYAHKAGIDEVMELATRIEDIGAHKGILVTTRGFQPGAVKMAKSKGIALVLAVDLQWNICCESPIREEFLFSSFATKIQLHTQGAYSKRDVIALYPSSAEATRLHPLEFGMLSKLQQRDLEAKEAAARVSKMHFAFPVKGKSGYVIAHEDLAAGDVVQGYDLDSNPFLCFDKEGLFSFIALASIRGR